MKEGKLSQNTLEKDFEDIQIRNLNARQETPEKLK